MSRMRSAPAPRAFAEVDTAAIAANFRTVSARCGKKPLAVVKANAYGHGVRHVVPALWAAGCRFFAVATAEEALEVRALAPFAEILVLGYAPPARARELALARITQTVFDATYARALAAHTVLPLAVHIKVDTGMCRLGFSCEETAQIRTVFAQKPLHVNGIFTHFPCADSDTALTEAQLLRFLAVKNALPPIPFAHAAASAAMLTLPRAILDGARVGLALYGISPVETALPLRPALRLCAPLVQIREVPAQTPVGYGGAFVTKVPSRIGVLPCGYADGLLRCLQGMTVRVRHQGAELSVPLCGRICMDQAMVDLTGTPAEVGDIVCVYSDIREVAARADTIPYEILTSISPRVERRTGKDVSI